MKRRRAIVISAPLIAVLLVATFWAQPSGAQVISEPSLPGSASSDRVPLGFDACRSGRPGCVRATIREMYRRWRPLDDRCDHKAVFALTYLRTTEAFADTVRRDPRFFSDPPWVNWEDKVFGQLYFDAVDAWDQDRPLPGAWRVAFEASESGDVTGPGDLLLGMNAHIQRDLPYTLAHVGLVKPDGRSRKRDHDRVNAILDQVIDPLQQELARRYDRLFRDTDAEPAPFDEQAALRAVRGFREAAWRNAERLVSARTEAERELVRLSIEEYAESQARLILAANTVPGYGAVRDAHCRAQNKRESGPRERGSREPERGSPSSSRSGTFSRSTPPRFDR